VTVCLETRTAAILSVQVRLRLRAWLRTSPHTVSARAGRVCSAHHLARIVEEADRSGFRRERREFSALEPPAAGVLRTPQGPSAHAQASVSLASPAGDRNAKNSPHTTVSGVLAQQTILREER